VNNWLTRISAKTEPERQQIGIDKNVLDWISQNHDLLSYLDMLVQFVNYNPGILNKMDMGTIDIDASLRNVQKSDLQQYLYGIPKAINIKSYPLSTVPQALNAFIKFHGYDQKIPNIFDKVPKSIEMTVAGPYIGAPTPFFPSIVYGGGNETNGQRLMDDLSKYNMDNVDILENYYKNLMNQLISVKKDISGDTKEKNR